MRGLAHNIVNTSSLLLILFNIGATYISPTGIVEVPNIDILAADASVLNEICLAT
jgi:hypothetical protein